MIRLSCIFLIILLLPLASAQASYHDTSFYLTSDPKTWDYSKIEWKALPIEAWTHIPPDKIKSIPADEINYDLLNPSQRQSMIASQIAANFEKIDNLKTLDFKEVKGAIQQKFGVTVDSISGDAKIKNGILTATEGGLPALPVSEGMRRDEMRARAEASYFTGQETVQDHIDLSNAFYKGTLIEAFNGRINVIPDEKVDISTIPKSDEFMLSADKPTTLKTPHGEILLSGGLRFDKGQPYTSDPRIKTTLSSVEIRPSHNQRTNIFFDGKTSTGPQYVSINPGHGELTSITSSGYLYLQFIENNPFLKNDQSKTRLTMVFAELSITQRPDLAPEVKIKTLDDPDVSAVSIVSGKIKLALAKEVISSSNPDGEKSSPMEIFLQSKTGQARYSLTDSNELSAKQVQGPELVYINYAKFSPDGFRKEFPNIELKPQGYNLESVTIKKLSEALHHLTPQLLESIREIKVYPDTEWKTETKRVFGVKSELVGAYTLGQTIVLPQKSIKPTTLQHESAHALNYKISNPEPANEAPRQEIAEPSRQVVSYYGSAKRQTFENQWLHANNDEYGKRINDGFTWASGKDTNNINYGYARPYGNKDLYEDIATMTEAVQDPTFYHGGYTDPASPNHHPAYAAKIKLLYENGFISQYTYKRAMPSIIIPTGQKTQSD